MEEIEYRSRRSNSCAPLEEAEFQQVLQAAKLYVSARSSLVSFIATLGNLVHRGMNTIPTEWRDDMLQKLAETLDFAQDLSIKGMDDEPGREPSSEWYAAVVSAAGAFSGAIGLPAVLAELPVTTVLILRSIADIGRAQGEQLNDPAFRQTCVEVFAYGSPLDEDEEDIAFIAARIGAVEIAQIAARYAASLAPRMAVSSIPIIGAGFGAAVNWAYMQFYQKMARVLFTLLPIERKYDRAQVRSCFGAIVEELRDQDSTRKPCS